MAKARVLIPLPDRDFDVTEVAAPWHELRKADIEVVFTTEEGREAAADPLLLTGVVFGQLGAAPDAKRLYGEMVTTEPFKRPVPYEAVDLEGIDGLLLPGGHAKGMRQYLESERLRTVVRALWSRRKPVAAICHGVIVLARTTVPETGRSLLFDRRTTCLPKYMERTAWLGTAWKLGDYYRTYPEYVEDEVRRALAHPEQFVRGPIHLMSRGSEQDDRNAFVVDDGHYVSARWPGDAFKLGKLLVDKVIARKSGRVSARGSAEAPPSSAR